MFPIYRDWVNDGNNVEENVEQVMSVIKTRKSIRITDQLKNQVRVEINNLRNTSLAIEAMEASPEFNFNWFVKMLRLDLFVSAEGALTPAVTGGAELGVRIFWTRTVKKNPVVINKMVTTVAQNNFVNGITKILSTLSTVNIDENTQVARKQGFSLDTIRLGLGFNVSGQVVVGKGTGSAVMNVFFAKKPVVS